MKLGVLTVPLYDRSAEEAFRYLSSLGVQTVEIGTGGSPGSKHSNPQELLSSETKLQAYKDMLKKYNLEISALSCHSNHVHPNEDVRIQAARDFTQTLQLAEKLGVDTVVSFSGCPGDHEGAKYPNWVTCSWPTDYQQVLDYQWNEVLIPFWKGAAAEAANYGVNKIALELHPGFCVYNTATLLRLREAVGNAIGANFDPSHLFWQGIHPAEAIKALKGAIYHFHAKDTKVDAVNTHINGVLDTGSYGGLSDRSWLFRTVGWGHDADQWKEIITALRLIGYDGAISIEHEDAFMSIEEGLEKAVAFLKDIIIKDQPAQVWWV
ncbi:sugar phosphate isomerase/epimerase [Anaerocolumna aminovalerica]|jgi:sugar phosphate isomerase/epimerase|uniref:Sugar phosphate isomerase/epimerase n=2 Tax=Anaerocolumna aminovalerica TaxID=1527 RepID=A0A1I5IPF0_9FIRM|nr:sugar phosphate isomerase/epimerase [Anaerocolumna aminovalerica]MBU5334463.1 sugar phosphate isomerase/epimerase [Anaerocolumna aminovalerica]MDU6266573.1 sugar phosphate isomerase/epimerase [Anaerocolumna aminovalerica]SFO62508.1 Sugar phosphate isomerase/epimerase [Anaerocolumna aminovalerica]